jgi:hypothetical protein
MAFPWFRWTATLATPILLSPLVFLMDDIAARCAYVVLVMPLVSHSTRYLSQFNT